MQPNQLIGLKRQKKVKFYGKLTEMQEEDLRKVSRHYPMALETFRKAYSGRFRASGVKAKCLECSNLQYAEVRDCVISGCPLWRYRPYQRNAEELICASTAPKIQVPQDDTRSQNLVAHTG